MRICLLVSSLAVLAAGCGSSSPAGPTPPPGGSPSQRITIGATGAVSPAEIVVSPGSRVLFVNEDGRRHDMSSDPHPIHTDCPEINQAGLLMPGQSRETGNLVVVGTCGFHDHENPNSAGLRGRIVIRP